MKFDQFTIVLLEHRPEAPNFDPKRASELQDAHLAYLAELHEEGYLLAAGPLLGAPDTEFRGLSLMRVERERAGI